MVGLKRNQKSLDILICLEWVMINWLSKGEWMPRIVNSMGQVMFATNVHWIWYGLLCISFEKGNEWVLRMRRIGCERKW